MNINKKGVVLCTPVDGYNKVSIFKNDIVIGENLIKGMYKSIRTNTTSTTSGYATCILTRDQIKALAGKKVTFSYYYSIEGARINGTSGNLGSRFGIHSSLNYTKTGASSATQDYPFANYLTVSGTGRAVMTWTVPDCSSINSEWGFSLQCAGNEYAKPSDVNTTWWIDRLKLEIGDKATPWCPAIADNMGGTPSTYTNVIQANDFIEI